MDQNHAHDLPHEHEHEHGGPLTHLLRRTGTWLLAAPPPLLAGVCLGHGFWIWALSARERTAPDDPSFLLQLAANLFHAPLFGVLALWVAALMLRGRAADRWPRVGVGQALAVLLPVAAYAVLDEWHQSRVVGRDASALDVVTDVVGASCVLWIVAFLGTAGGSTAAGSRRIERGLRRRLWIGVALCLTSALLASLL